MTQKGTAGSEQLKEYICNEDDLGCLNDYFYAALDQNEPKTTLIRLWEQEFGVIRSRPHTSAPAPSTVVEDITFEGAAIVQAAKREAAKAAREQVLGLARDMYSLMMCVEKTNTDEFMEYYAERMRGLKEQYESLRSQQEPQQ